MKVAFILYPGRMYINVHSELPYIDSWRGWENIMDNILSVDSDIESPEYCKESRGKKPSNVYELIL